MGATNDGLGHDANLQKATLSKAHAERLALCIAQVTLAYPSVHQSGDIALGPNTMERFTHIGPTTSDATRAKA